MESNQLEKSYDAEIHGHTSTLLQWQQKLYDSVYSVYTCIYFT